jgi:type I restriction enzyme, R subunit
MTPEQRALQDIDAQLLASGWIVQDYPKMDLSAGLEVALRELQHKSGRCGCLLLADRKPFGVLGGK